MNYNSKRLINPLKPICKCKAQEFNTLVDVIRGSTSTKDYNRNIAFRKAIEELTSLCTDKEYLTLAEIVKVIPYTATKIVSIECDVFNKKNKVKPNGFFILVGNDNGIKQIESIYFNGSYYSRSSKIDPAQEDSINNLRFPLTDKDIMLIEKSLAFSGNFGVDYTSNTEFMNRNHTGTIYIYKLNGTD
jgi:hypothetical protein